MSEASSLPPLFDRWLAGALPGQIPEEPRSTCSSCALVPSPTQPAPNVSFRADTKCCTYQPELHNFQVGGVLASESDRATSWGRTILDMRLARRTGVTPLGIRPPALSALLYERVVEPSGAAFGRMKEARCPFYLSQGGRCGVWRQRNAVCSTWFCRFDRGLRSKRFWRATLGLLRACERSVSTWAALELDVGPDALRKLLFHDQRRDGNVQDAIMDVDASTYSSLWGKWAGREREFYIEAANMAEALSWDEVLALGGTEMRLLADIVGHVYERLTSDELPRAVGIGPEVIYQIQPNKPDSLRVATRGLSYDFLELTREIVDLLPQFEGRNPEEVLRELDAAGGREGLDVAAVRRFLDHGVLVAAPGSNERESSDA